MEKFPDRETEARVAEFALRACRNWQESKWVHPMTCRSKMHDGVAVIGDAEPPPRPVLKPEIVEREGEQWVGLVCPDCGGVQLEIPPVVIEIQAFMDQADPQAPTGYPFEMIRAQAMPRFLMGG